MVSFWSFPRCVVSLLFLFLSINISRVLSLTLCLSCLHAPSQGSASLPRLQVYPLLCRGIPGPPWTCQKKCSKVKVCIFYCCVPLRKFFSLWASTSPSTQWGEKLETVFEGIEVLARCVGCKLSSLLFVCLFENIWISFWLNQLRVPLSFEKGIYAQRKFYNKVCT